MELAGAHSDYGFITLLATDDVSGLQSIVVNIGDMLERWSNSIFRKKKKIPSGSAAISLGKPGRPSVHSSAAVSTPSKSHMANKLFGSPSAIKSKSSAQPPTNPITVTIEENVNGHLREMALNTTLKCTELCVTPRPKRVEVLQIWCDIKGIHNHNTSINSGSLK
ncbi:probable iron/ascorbate oxidoreductase [Tanacetum coccineum]